MATVKSICPSGTELRLAFTILPFFSDQFPDAVTIIDPKRLPFKNGAGMIISGMAELDAMDEQVINRFFGKSNPYEFAGVALPIGAWKGSKDLVETFTGLMDSSSDFLGPQQLLNSVVNSHGYPAALFTYVETALSGDQLYSAIQTRQIVRLRL